MSLTNKVAGPAAAEELSLLLQSGGKPYQKLRTPFDARHLVARLGLQSRSQSLRRQTLEALLVDLELVGLVARKETLGQSV